MKIFLATLQFQYTLMQMTGEGFVLVLQSLDIFTHVTSLESDFFLFQS